MTDITIIKTNDILYSVGQAGRPAVAFGTYDEALAGAARFQDMAGGPDKARIVDRTTDKPSELDEYLH